MKVKKCQKISEAREIVKKIIKLKKWQQRRGLNAA